MAKRLTYTQQRILELLEKERDPMWGAHGMAEHGGRARSLDSLVRQGLVEAKFTKIEPTPEAPHTVGRWDYVLTGPGKMVLESARADARG